MEHIPSANAMMTGNNYWPGNGMKVPEPPELPSLTNVWFLENAAGWSSKV